MVKLKINNHFPTLQKRLHDIFKNTAACHFSGCCGHWNLAKSKCWLSCFNHRFCMISLIQNKAQYKVLSWKQPHGIYTALLMKSRNLAWCWVNNNIVYRKKSLRHKSETVLFWKSLYHAMSLLAQTLLKGTLILGKVCNDPFLQCWPCTQYCTVANIRAMSKSAFSFQWFVDCWRL